MSLLDEINAKCPPELIAAGEHGQIAAIVSEGRTRIAQPTYIGRGTISDAIRMPNGPVFTRSLRLMAQAPLPDGAPLSALQQKAAIEEAWALLEAGRLDVGLDSVRNSILAMVGVLPGLDADGAQRILAVAVEPAPVSVQEVIDAMEGK